MRQCLFLDRDGVLNVDTRYLSDPKNLVISNSAAKLINLCNQSNILVVVVTNQSGIARGYFSETRLQSINTKLKKLYLLKDARIDDFFYCPHLPGLREDNTKFECSCRKPKPGMILSAQLKWNIDLKNSWLIGDKESDILSGINAGIPSAKCIKVSAVSEDDASLSFDDSVFFKETINLYNFLKFNEKKNK